jgi:hypothetical protein
VTPVKSDSIAAIGHDAASRVLSVKFKSGETYSFKGVSADQHAALLGAESKGSHFQTHIRPKFKGTKQK